MTVRFLLKIETTGFSHTLYSLSQHHYSDCGGNDTELFYLKWLIQKEFVAGFLVKIILLCQPWSRCEGILNKGAKPPLHWLDLLRLRSSHEHTERQKKQQTCSGGVFWTPILGCGQSHFECAHHSLLTTRRTFGVNAFLLWNEK